jgi:hypothetical protein
MLKYRQICTSGPSAKLGKIQMPAKNSDIAVHDICFIPGFVTARDEDRTIILITTYKPASGMQLATPMLSPAHPPP